MLWGQIRCIMALADGSIACPLCWWKSLPMGPRTLEWAVIFFKVFMLPPASAERKARRKGGEPAQRAALYIQVQRSLGTLFTRG